MISFFQNKRSSTYTLNQVWHLFRLSKVEITHVDKVLFRPGCDAKAVKAFKKKVFPLLKKDEISDESEFHKEIKALKSNLLNNIDDEFYKLWGQMIKTAFEYGEIFDLKEASVKQRWKIMVAELQKVLKKDLVKHGNHWRSVYKEKDYYNQVNLSAIQQSVLSFIAFLKFSDHGKEAEVIHQFLAFSRGIALKEDAQPKSEMVQEDPELKEQKIKRDIFGLGVLTGPCLLAGLKLQDKLYTEELIESISSDVKERILREMNEGVHDLFITKINQELLDDEKEDLIVGVRNDSIEGRTLNLKREIKRAVTTGPNVGLVLAAKQKLKPDSEQRLMEAIKQAFIKASELKTYHSLEVEDYFLKNIAYALLSSTQFDVYFDKADYTPFSQQHTTVLPVQTRESIEVPTVKDEKKTPYQRKLSAQKSYIGVKNKLEGFDGTIQQQRTREQIKQHPSFSILPELDLKQRELVLQFAGLKDKKVHLTKSEPAPFQNDLEYNLAALSLQEFPNSTTTKTQDLSEISDNEQRIPRKSASYSGPSKFN